MRSIPFTDRPICELCGTTGGKTLLRRSFSDPALRDFLEEYYGGRVNVDDLAGGEYQVVRCQACQFIWQAQVLDQSGMALLYGTWIDSEQSLSKKKYAGIGLYKKYADEALRISRFIAKEPFEIRVLDFGMGWGYWASMARSFGYDVTGLEVSPERVEFAPNGAEVH